MKPHQRRIFVVAFNRDVRGAPVLEEPEKIDGEETFSDTTFAIGDEIETLHRQLAGVLRRMGYDEEAAHVMVAKNEDYAKHFYFSSLSQWPQPLWYYFIGWLAGYGYLPKRAFGISLGFIVIGVSQEDGVAVYPIRIEPAFCDANCVAICISGG